MLWRAQLDDLGATRLEHALGAASSVSQQNAFGGLWDGFAVRGFAGDPNTGPIFLRNGFSTNRGFNPPRDTAHVERIEFLKGPASALYGRGEPGGTLNIVTKQPRSEPAAGAARDLASAVRHRHGARRRLRAPGRNAPLRLRAEPERAAREPGRLAGRPRPAAGQQPLGAVSALSPRTLAARFPLRGAVELVFDQRLAVNNSWDEPRETALQRFRARHPEHTALAVPEGRFSWPWYFAMQENGDWAVREELQTHSLALAERQRWGEWAQQLLRPLALQALLDRSAGTDRAAQTAYRASVGAHHEQLKRFFFPRIAADARLPEPPFGQIPRHLFRAPHGQPPASALAGLGLWLLAPAALLLLGARSHSNRRHPR